MGVPKKPALLKELNGSAAHHPERTNKSAPVPTAGIGPAPKRFNKDQSDTWDYLVSIMHPGILGNSDRPTMEVMTILFWRFQFCEHHEGSTIPPLMGNELSQMCSLMAKYGMNPSDRQNLQVPEGKKKNSFDI